MGGGGGFGAGAPSSNASMIPAAASPYSSSTSTGMGGMGGTGSSFSSMLLTPRKRTRRPMLRWVVNDTLLRVKRLQRCGTTPLSRLQSATTQKTWVCLVLLNALAGEAPTVQSSITQTRTLSPKKLQRIARTPLWGSTQLAPVLSMNGSSTRT